MSAAAHRSVLVEADGGSRGNPGPAAYGAVLLDAETREVIAERAERLGVATNNVAEYRGLIAGLELYNEHTPGADLEVRMDSKLVVEQMSGRWKIKHPDMKPLAAQAARLAPPGRRTPGSRATGTRTPTGSSTSRSTRRPGSRQARPPGSRGSTTREPGSTTREPARPPAG